MPRSIEAASAPWPALRDVPRASAYLVTTTWRDILDAAATVGRDPIPWFAAMPELAHAELIARWSPLMAYLRRRHNPWAWPGSSGYLIEPNAVYYHGTERTARGAFGYRLGMTMAEWACRGLMGLGPTLHAETSAPTDAGPTWLTTASLPDLVGDHWHPPTTWLVEAKGTRRTGLTVLTKGVQQLTGRGLMSGPHVRVLCGTSLEPRLFVTIDVEISPAWAPRATSAEVPDPAADDSVLLSLARSRMLTYYSLQALSAGARFVRPVGPILADPGFWRPRIGLVYPLEQDPSTQEERLLARDTAGYADRRPSEQRLDMLTGRVPGTDMVVGMSRRLFEACRDLAADEEEIADETQPEERPPIADQRGRVEADDQLDEYQHERRAAFAAREAASRPRLRTAARQGFERGRHSTWNELLPDEQLTINASPQPGLLESATADTYLAIDTSLTFL
jgi:hypothetical protein